jgi:two-component system NtrC family sensor kinase
MSVVLLLCLLVTIKIWDFYVNNIDPLERNWVSMMILAMGSLFSVATGLMIWNLERRNKQVQKAYRQLKEANEQLIQSEKLASIGRVVAGIVHELNAPLVTMQGYTQMLMKGVIKEEAESSAALIHKQAERCHKIVRALLTYARSDQPKIRPVVLKDVIELSLSHMPPEFHRDVQIRKHYPASPLEIPADPDQLERVFTNLFMNAWQAMQEKEMKNTPQIDLTLSQGPQKALIEVHDSGPGIPKDLQLKIFEPFFTTKPAGKGTGLGLSLCYSIIAMHEGSLCVESEPGLGTSFKIELPLTSLVPASAVS